LLQVFIFLILDQKEVTGVRNGTKENVYKMLELVAHVTSEKNRSLVPICEHFSFAEIEKALTKVESSNARYQCVVKIEEDIVSRFNKNEL
jgi:D-arabinose 1-dehydrogenase-like Zn-dependent alcohol dehydrogenase